MKKIIFTDEQIELIKKLYDENLSLLNIAEKLKVGRSSIKRFINELNLPKRNLKYLKRKFQNQEDKNLIKSMYIDDGYSICKIKNIFDVSQDAVEKVLIEFGFGTEGKKVKNQIEMRSDPIIQLEVKKLFDLGYGRRKIGKKLNIHSYQIKEIFKILNLPAHERNAKKKFDNLNEYECSCCGQVFDIKHFMYIDENNKVRYKGKCDICIKLRRMISGRINKSLLKIKSSKNRESSIKNLPYTIKELKEHLESLFEPWMNFNNHGQYNPNMWNDNDSSTWKWQVDHVQPHSTFKYKSIHDEEFKKCWSLSNLRPLSAKENLLDGVNRIRH
jgi:predicted DNA-binding protein YlxM (UPF0122 family)